MRRSIEAIAVAACLTFAACSGQSQQSSSPQATTQPTALTNPTDFPLTAGSTVLDVKPFSQTITTSGGHASALASSGAGTYSGEEVLAESTASAPALRAWLAGLKTAPPAGYAYRPASSASIEQTLQRYDIAYAAFTKTGSAKPRGVVIVVMDPKLVSSKIGIVVDLVSRYRELPDAMRKSIDDEIKAKVGFSATEATDPSAPLGMTLDAIQQLRTTQNRAIVMVDATKQ